MIKIIPCRALDFVKKNVYSANQNNRIGEKSIHRVLSPSCDCGIILMFTIFFGSYFMCIHKIIHNWFCFFLYLWVWLLITSWNSWMTDFVLYCMSMTPKNCVRIGLLLKHVLARGYFKQWQTITWVIYVCKFEWYT